MGDSILHRRVSNWVVVVLLLLIAGWIAMIIVDGRRTAEHGRKAEEFLAFFDRLEYRLKDGDKSALLDLADCLEKGYGAYRAQELCIDFVEGRKPLHEAVLAKWIREQFPYLEFDRSSKKYRRSGNNWPH
jgi:hypothetical protein